MTYFLGIDIGSVSTDAVLIDEDGNICASSIMKTGVRHGKTIQEVTNEACEAAGIEPGKIESIVSTGYGRENVTNASEKITEVTAHAAGVLRFFPKTRTIIDIGGQDTKVIKLDESGKVEDFILNDKCAAGTGQFLENISERLGVKIEELGKISAEAEERLKINSTCTVFAGSEVVTLLSENKKVPDIVAALHDAVSAQAASMAKRVGLECEVSLTGGVARNGGIVNSVNEALKTSVNVPENPQITGALGAALRAREFMLSESAV